MTGKEGLPYSVMLTQFILDIGVVVERHEIENEGSVSNEVSTKEPVAVFLYAI